MFTPLCVSECLSCPLSPQSVPTQQPARGQLQLTQPIAAQQQPRGRRAHRGPIGPLQPAQIEKLLSELDTVRRNLDIMSEIMVENEPGQESEDDAQLLEVRAMEIVGGSRLLCSFPAGIESCPSPNANTSRRPH